MVEFSKENAKKNISLLSTNIGKAFGIGLTAEERRGREAEKLEKLKAKEAQIKVTRSIEEQEAEIRKAKMRNRPKPQPQQNNTGGGITPNGSIFGVSDMFDFPGLGPQNKKRKK